MPTKHKKATTRVKNPILNKVLWATGIVAVTVLVVLQLNFDLSMYHFMNNQSNIQYNMLIRDAIHSVSDDMASLTNDQKLSEARLQLAAPINDVRYTKYEAFDAEPETVEITTRRISHSSLEYVRTPYVADKSNEKDIVRAQACTRAFVIVFTSGKLPDYFTEDTKIVIKKQLQDGRYMQLLRTNQCEDSGMGGRINQAMDQLEVALRQIESY